MQNYSGFYRFHLNPLLHNISMQILHTLLRAFPLVLTRRICLWKKPLKLAIIALFSHYLKE